MKKINIHFVCRGNVYRSRMAELYAKSLRLDNFEFSSSGIWSDDNYSDKTYISPIDEYVIQVKHLDLRDSPLGTQTTQEILDASDKIIFMSADIRDKVRDRLHFDASKARDWDVDDIDVTAGVNDDSEMSIELQHTTGEATFEKVRRHVDALVAELQH